MNTSASSSLAARFHLTLPPDLEAWLDSSACEEQYPIDFGVPLPPRELLREKSGLIWGGQMLPDSLPILDNGCGDCLCLRIRPDGSVREVVRWNHEGVMWTPRAATFAEAVLFELAVELTSPDKELSRDDVAPLLDGALRHMDVGSHQQARLAPLFEHPSPDIFTRFAELGIAEIACRQALCEPHCSDAPIQEIFSRRLGRRRAGDWKEAAAQARQVIDARTDLRWPFVVAGWAADQQGEVRAAICHYIQALWALGTTAEFTELWAWPTAFSGIHFAADRLKALADEIPSEVAGDALLQIALSAPHARAYFEAVRQHWLDVGHHGEQAGNYAQAYEWYYRAGWDDYCFDWIEEVLVRLHRCAQAAGWEALARIAECHLTSMG